MIAPNPTGSTGYGQAFTDAINKNWGGDPYRDIVNVFEWVGENMSEVDNDNAVALGASYGGYMVNSLGIHLHKELGANNTVDELDSRPRSGPEIQGFGLSRRHL